MLGIDAVYCMDALVCLSSIPDGHIDLTLCSPPYDNLRSYRGYSFDFEPIATELYRVIKPGGVLVWVVGDSIVDGSETLTSFKQALYFREIGFNVHQTMIFHDPGTPFPDPTRYTRSFEYMFVLSKGRPKTINLQTQKNKWAGDKRPKGSLKTQQEPDGSRSVRVRKPVKEYGVLGNVWTLGTGHGKSTKDEIAFQHPAIFPEELARRHILTWSNPGDLIFDPFVGSGTTVKIARNLERHYLGCDIAEDYIQIAQARLEQTDPFKDRVVAPGLTQNSLFKEEE